MEKWYLVKETKDGKTRIKGIFANELEAQKYTCLQDNPQEHDTDELWWWELTRLIMEITFGQVMLT